MFERYTEGARRTIFFARYEAAQIGPAYIETEHILLGLLREDRRCSDAATRRRVRVHSQGSDNPYAA
jgi:ATP-dependent Clp protease ATP-binding subunit ClpC